MARLSTSIKANNAATFKVLERDVLPYEESRALQLDLVRRRIEGSQPDTLLLVEHFPVVTYGRGTKKPPVTDIPVVEVERGGEDTLHSPGQLIGYPIIYLPEGRRDLHRYLRDLEEVLIRTLADFGIEAGRKKLFTGVWVGEKKIASIGVACKSWVTYHGFALNVSNDLSLFREINPCGLDPEVMTSMESVSNGSLSISEVKVKTVQNFRSQFGL